MIGHAGDAWLRKIPIDRAFPIETVDGLMGEEGAMGLV
jgi:hypothetical protein